MIKLKEILETPQTGKPFKKIVYRGDDEEFAEFDPERIGIKGFETVGFWFSGTEDAAASYGEHVRPFEITMKNPMVFSQEDFRKIYPKGPPYLAQTAKNKGYDGIVILNIIDGDRWSDVYCVFNPSQIKPVIPDKEPS